MSRLPLTAPTLWVPARVSPATATTAPAGTRPPARLTALARRSGRDQRSCVGGVEDSPVCGELTIGIEEEFMLLEPDRWSLAFRSDEVLAALPAELRDRVTLETHAAVMEIATGVHRRIGDAVTELASCASGWRAPCPRRGCAPPSRARIRARRRATRCSRPIPATGRSATRCACSRGASRPWPHTSTSACRAQTRDPAPQSAARAPAAAARPLGQLALLAGPAHWLRVDANDALRRVPAPGLPRGFRDYADWVATVERLLRSGAIPTPRSSGGTCACSRATAPSRYGSWTGRPPSRTWLRSPRSSRRSRASSWSGTTIPGPSRPSS